MKEEKENILDKLSKTNVTKEVKLGKHIVEVITPNKKEEKEKDYSKEFYMLSYAIAFLTLGYFLSIIYKPMTFIFIINIWIFGYIIWINMTEYLIKHKVK